MQCLGNPD